MCRVSSADTSQSGFFIELGNRDGIEKPIHAGLEGRLAELHSRVNCGSYRALQSRRVYIEEGDGQKRPLGISPDIQLCFILGTQLVGN